MKFLTIMALLLMSLFLTGCFSTTKTVYVYPKEVNFKVPIVDPIKIQKNFRPESLDFLDKNRTFIKMSVNDFSTIANRSDIKWLYINSLEMALKDMVMQVQRYIEAQKEIRKNDEH